MLDLLSDLLLGITLECGVGTSNIHISTRFLPNFTAPHFRNDASCSPAICFGSLHIFHSVSCWTYPSETSGIQFSPLLWLVEWWLPKYVHSVISRTCECHLHGNRGCADGTWSQTIGGDCPKLSGSHEFLKWKRKAESWVKEI